MSDLKLISFPKNSTQYLAPTWDQMNQLAFEMCQKIDADRNKFNRVVTLAKGGWPMTRSLVDFLQVDEVASIGVKFYKGENDRYDHPQIYQDIPTSIQGETILLFDDVADTGESLKFTIDYLKIRGVKEVKTATLYYKPHSAIKPDYYGAKTSAWIVFPYEAREMIVSTSKKWLEAGLDKKEILNRFNKLNFNSEWTEYFLNRIDK
ncbi:MAG: phosphoribosyltransferase family protein [Patescibacteria group bacterium]|nr:phosphoribosyltransferase family protein [Patescibacteria group bacterium]